MGVKENFYFNYSDGPLAAGATATTPWVDVVGFSTISVGGSTTAGIIVSPSWVEER